jgi:DNA-binding NarL/FixJ family response regulator
MRIAVADEHQIVRRGLQLVISRCPGWTIAAEAADADQLFSALRSGVFDVLVIDFRLRDRSGIDLLGQIRREHPSLPVLVLSSQPEEQYAIPALRAGARGYVQKDATAEEILTAIERVAAGRRWVSERVSEILADELAQPKEVPHERLSAREREVFLLLARGETITRIAEILRLSVKTVSTYRARIMEKTGFRTNADIVAYAIRSGLME